MAGGGLALLYASRNSDILGLVLVLVAGMMHLFRSRQGLAMVNSQ
jgi:hypothetical protein